MNSKEIITKTEEYVKKALSGEGSGHDWWHIARVQNSANYIAKKERGADLLAVNLAALLHDIADRKFNGGDLDHGVEKVRIFLKSIFVENDTIEHVCEIVDTCSYAKSFMKDGKRREMKTLEGKIVQDADRLDALGAIGIARAFAYGGSKGRELYNPDQKVILPTSTKEYTLGSAHTIAHFYEKLLLLKDLMNTKTARKIAKKRHAFIELFLKEFYSEWAGEVI